MTNWKERFDKRFKPEDLLGLGVCNFSPRGSYLEVKTFIEQELTKEYERGREEGHKQALEYATAKLKT
jgi:hypothetical protein